MPTRADLRSLQIAALVATVILGAFVVFGDPPIWLIAVTLSVYVVALVLTLRDTPSNLNPIPSRQTTEGPDPVEHELIEGLEQAVVVCSFSGLVRLANAAAKDLFKAPALVGMNLRHVALSEDLIDLMDQALTTQAKSPISKEFSVDYPEPRSLRVRARRVDSEVALWIANVSDIRRLETVRRDFVANVSHELRTPMASIRAMAETIEDDPDITNEERDAYLDKIITEVDRLTLLSEDLLTLAAAEAQPSEQAEIDLAEIARYAVQQMESHASARA